MRSGLVIQHVSLEVPPEEVERMVEFWGILGFQRVPAPEAIASEVTWLEHEVQQVHLIHTPEATAPQLGHTAVIVQSYEATLEAMREAGFAVEETRELWGERRAFAVAAAGHRVELMAVPPPGST